MNAKPISEDARIYIVDGQYRIVHFNSVLGKAFPSLKVGELCYRALCGENAPCTGCPLTRERSSTSIFYNQLVRKWVEVNIGAIEWPGVGPCSAVFIRPIHEGNRYLFYNMTSSSSYDELFEMNLSQNTYEMLFEMKEKYITPLCDGNLTAMLAEVEEHMIHPDDREAFKAFWSLDSLPARLAAEGDNKTLRGHFRRRKVDGSYCWVAQTVVPVRSGENGEEIVMCFLQDIDSAKRRELEQDLQRRRQEEDELDPLTGLYRRAVFLQRAEQFLQEADDGPYCLVAIDIEHFKLFNEWYGQEAGDRFLTNIGAFLREAAKESGGVAGYMGGDDFGIILPDRADVVGLLQTSIIRYAKKHGRNAGFLPAFGIYPIVDKDVSAGIMYDSAAIALEEVKGNYARRSCRFDSSMKHRMEENHVLLSEIQRALAEGEITFYAQPQCNMSTGKIIGIESLVRWNHPKRGLIPPSEFIPLLEENGFITNLDLYVWDRVCARVRKWIDMGHRAVPISVNVSRVDIYSLNVARVLKKLVEKYGLEPGLLEVEITESAYAEDTAAIAAAVEELRSAGFTVFMDDFGSGYSSLNMLKDMNMDVLKIDMKFLDMDEKSVKKGVGILEAIANMARLMGLRMIAEGVETRRQADFLLNIGCLYGQGYYFYRPMPVDALEALLANEEGVDFRGLAAGQMERLRVKDLLNGDVVSEILINNILGAVAFYEVNGSQVQLVRANEEYCKVMHTNLVDLEEHRLGILDWIHREDQQKALEIFGSARTDLLNGAQGEVRRLLDNGDMIWVQIRVFFLREQGGRQLFYGALCDVTEQRRREQELKASQRALAAVVHISESDEGLLTVTEENRREAAAISVQMSPGGMIGGYCEDGYPLYFANYEMVKLMGYESYGELAEAIGGMVIHTIHPDDRKRVMEDIGSDYYPGLEYTTTYRMPRKDGSWFWVLDKGKVIRAEDGRLAIVSACTDISETMEAQKRLVENNAQLTRQNQELHFLNNQIPGGYHRCKNDESMELTYISNRFLSIFGYSREEIQERFGNRLINMVHPDDRKAVYSSVCYTREKAEMRNLECRMLGKNGYIWVVYQSQYVCYGDREFLQGVVLDITSRKEKEHELWLAGQRMESILRLADLNCWEWDMEAHTLSLLNVAYNDRLAETYGLFDSEQVMVQNFPACLTDGGYLMEESGPVYRAYLERVQAEKNHGCSSCEIAVRVKEGGVIWIRSVCETICDADERPVRAVGYYADITRQKQEELRREGQIRTLELLRSQAIYDFQVNLTADAIMLDESSKEWQEQVAVEDGEYTNSVEHLQRKYVLPEFREQVGRFMDRGRLLALYQSGVFNDSIDYRRMYRGEARWMRTVVYLMQVEGRPDVQACVFVMDINDQKLQEQELVKMAETDYLTGLYNRQAGQLRIGRYLKELADGETAALIMLDIDNFKAANDVFGHAYGDRMIEEHAAKLRRMFDAGDIICRIGGDEFLILCRGLKAEEAEGKLAELIRSMDTVRRDNGREIRFSVSGGYVMVPADGEQFEELCRKADIALFAAKMEGKRCFRHYEPDMKTVRYELADRE